MLNSNGGNIVVGGGATPATGYAVGNASTTGGHTLYGGITVLGDIHRGRRQTPTTRAAWRRRATGLASRGGLLSSNGTVTIDGISVVSEMFPTFVAGVHFANSGTRLRRNMTGTVTVTGQVWA